MTLDKRSERFFEDVVEGVGWEETADFRKFKNPSASP
jgi:hypothetical protein